MSKKSPEATDVKVGARVRHYRLKAKMSQTDLANALGLTFQQIQKYENGANRIGSSRLYRIAHVLRLPDMNLFFEDCEPLPGQRHEHDGLTVVALPPAADRLTLHLVQAFETIGDPKLRKAVVDLAEAASTPERRAVAA